MDFIFLNLAWGCDINLLLIMISKLEFLLLEIFLNRRCYGYRLLVESSVCSNYVQFLELLFLNWSLDTKLFLYLDSRYIFNSFLLLVCLLNSVIKVIFQTLQSFAFSFKFRYLINQSLLYSSLLFNCRLLHLLLFLLSGHCCLLS